MQGAQYLGSILAWYKASGRQQGWNEDPTADEWTNTKIPIKHHNLDTLHIVALLERLRQLITSNKVVKICQIS